MPSGMSPLRARAMKVALLLQRSAGWGRCAGWMIPDSQSMLDRQVSQSGNEAQRSEMRTMCRRSTRAADGRLARQMSHEDEELGYSMPLKLGEGFASGVECGALELDARETPGSTHRRPARRVRTIAGRQGRGRGL